MYHASPLLPMQDERIVETALQALNKVRKLRACINGIPSSEADDITAFETTFAQPVHDALR